MRYERIIQGIFISRPNRFIANVEVNGQIEITHVKNTGRCKELLTPGARVLLQKAANPSRKTGFDLISVWKGDRLINMDSQAPNAVFREYLEFGRFIEGLAWVKPEARYSGSRFDFYVEAGSRRIFIEVKGVTLEEKGIAMFPDAPTLRGIKHLHELSACIKDGYEAHVVFVIQMRGVKRFSPNNRTHPAFGEALAAAEAAGVKVSALDCEVAEDSLAINSSVPVEL